LKKGMISSLVTLTEPDNTYGNRAGDITFVIRISNICFVSCVGEPLKRSVRLIYGHQEMKTDQSIKNFVTASIRRHSTNIDSWAQTRLWDEGDPEIKAEIAAQYRQADDELPILYPYIGAAEVRDQKTLRALS